MSCILIILVWAVTGPLFGFSDTWQLVINTGTTIITFLMVFLIQNSQNRDGAAIQVKLDELIRVSTAHNSFVGVEHLTDEEIEEIRNTCKTRAKIATDPSPGVPTNLSGNFGIYSVFEQKIYRMGNDDDRGIGIFARVSSSPSDRNLIDLYADGGIQFIGLSDSRPKDKLGTAAGYAMLACHRGRAGSISITSSSWGLTGRCEVSSLF